MSEQMSEQMSDIHQDPEDADYSEESRNNPWSLNDPVNRQEPYHLGLRNSPLSILSLTQEDSGRDPSPAFNVPSPIPTDSGLLSENDISVMLAPGTKRWAEVPTFGKLVFICPDCLRARGHNMNIAELTLLEPDDQALSLGKDAEGAISVFNGTGREDLCAQPEQTLQSIKEAIIALDTEPEIWYDTESGHILPKNEWRMIERSIRRADAPDCHSCFLVFVKYVPEEVPYTGNRSIRTLECPYCHKSHFFP